MAGTDPPNDATPDDSEQAPARRTPTRVFIAVVLAVQLLVPLTYYLRDDPYDERFAWRMFSGIRMHQCETRAIQTRGGHEERLSLVNLVNVRWITQLRRNRRDVIDAFLARRCRDEGVTAARIMNVCDPTGDEGTWITTYARHCPTRTVTVSRERAR